MQLSQSHLKARLHYEPETGLFFTKLPISKSQPIPPGTPAGHLTAAGYLRICVLGKYHMAHRLAWLYVRGVFPEADIDHINGVRSDNRIANLRDVSRATNSQNRVRLNANNTSGYRGVTYRPRQGWVAQIGFGGKQVCIGIFSSREEARAAFEEARVKHHA